MFASLCPSCLQIAQYLMEERESYTFIHNTDMCLSHAMWLRTIGHSPYHEAGMCDYFHLGNLTLNGYVCLIWHYWWLEDCTGGRHTLKTKLSFNRLKIVISSLKIIEQLALKRLLHYHSVIHHIRQHGWFSADTHDLLRINAVILLHAMHLAKEISSPFIGTFN